MRYGRIGGRRERVRGVAEEWVGGWERRERVRGVGGVVKLMKPKKKGGGNYAVFYFPKKIFFNIFMMLLHGKKGKKALLITTHTHTHTHTHTGTLDWTEFTMVAKHASVLNIIQVAHVLLMCC